jgi:hypothetical protein
LGRFAALRCFAMLCDALGRFAASRLRDVAIYTRLASWLRQIGISLFLLFNAS